MSNTYKYLRMIAPIQVVDSKDRPVSKRDQVQGIDGKLISVNTGKPEDPWTTRVWLEELILGREGWEKGAKKMAAALRLVEAIIEAEDRLNGHDVTPTLVEAEIRGEDWLLVKDTIEDEEFVMPIPHGRQLYPFVHEWLHAADESRIPKPVPQPEAAVIERETAE